MQTAINNKALAPEFAPLKKPETFTNHINTLVNKDKYFYTASELLNRNVEKIPCLVDPILPRAGVCSLAGSSDTGKSSLLRQLAVSVCSSQEEFLGFQLEQQHKKAIYVSTEDDDYAISYLLKKSGGIEPDDASGLIFIFDTENLLEKLQRILEVQPVDLIIIDAFADLYGKSLNEANQVRTFLNEYSQIANRHGCLIMFLHHTGKRTDDLAPSKHNLLGSQGFEAKMRLVLELRNDPQNPHIRHLCIVKGNYVPQEYKSHSYELRFNDKLCFTNTGERRAFEELSPSNNARSVARAKKLQEEGKTQVEISEITGISQPTISRYLNPKK